MVARANTTSVDLTLKELQQIRKLSQQIRQAWTPEQREWRAQVAAQKLSFLFEKLHS